jgi:hypothetical protein
MLGLVRLGFVKANDDNSSVYKPFPHGNRTKGDRPHVKNIQNVLAGVEEVDPDREMPTRKLYNVVRDTISSQGAARMLEEPRNPRQLEYVAMKQRSKDLFEFAQNEMETLYY